jgi:hypothetical protein
MLKKTLINNAIVLAIHILSLVIFAVVLILTEATEEQYVFLLAILYTLGGFFLIPVKKRSFLSVISISVVLIGLFVAIDLLSRVDDAYLWGAYYFFNPTLFILDDAIGYTAPRVLETLVFSLSTVFPSLLLYLGMVLRRLWRKATEREQEAPKDET